MKLNRLLFSCLAVASLAGIVLLGQQTEQTGGKMVRATENFLGSLSAAQKKQAVFPFDSKERTNWNFVPLQTEDRRPTRKGLPLAEMSDEQRKAALELVRSGTSATGYVQATTIMSLESILRDLEKGGRMVRDPDWYFFTVFGTPSRTGRWGWRVEGHHLSLNFTLDRGKVVSATPAFFGANPATVKAGSKKGTQTLGDAEKLAKSLFDSLDAEQRKVALQVEQFPEIEQAKTIPGVGPPRGIAADKLTSLQKTQLLALIQSYAKRMPPEVAELQLKDLEEAGVDRIHFGFAQDSAKPGKPYTYRVQGPTFVIEFLNIQADSAQNPANHIHSSWRTIAGDFGIVQK